jgi:tetratricopeptide (TPR) repeat protein
MLIPRIRVRLLLPFCFLITVALLSLTPLTARNSFRQETPPQTEEQRQARDVLNKGVENFKNGRTDEAINDFTRAKQLDPQLLNARLYLATSYASLYIPGAPSEENRQKGEAAIAEFRDVLNFQPDNLSAIDGIGSLLFQMGGQPFDADKFVESKSFHRRHIQIKPDDPEPYYWIGVIDWTLSYRADREMRAGFNQHARENEKLGEADPLPPELRETYAREYGPTIEEGIASLKQALVLRPEYDDAMAYLNLLYRRKADTVASKTERDQLNNMADDLLDKLKEIKQKRIESLPQ